MASKIDGTTITLTRGDSFFCDIGLKDGEDPYTPLPGDVIRFALKSNRMVNGEYADQQPLISKIIPNDTLLLHLLPADTKNLSLGSYDYDVEITFADGEVDTFIADAEFILTRKVD